LEVGEDTVSLLAGDFPHQMEVYHSGNGLVYGDVTEAGFLCEAFGRGKWAL